MTSTKTKKEEPALSGLELLRAPFPKELISYLPKPTCPAADYKKLKKAQCKVCGNYHATSKTIHLAYVGHAALTARLLQVDIEWKWEPFALDDVGLPLLDSTGGLWMRLTVCGFTRIGYGHAKENPYAEIGSRMKEIIGDGIRNSAMRFGAALDLWSKADLTKVVEDENNASEDNNNGPELITEEQVIQIKDFLEDERCNVGDLLKWAKVEKIEAIPASKFNLAVAGLTKRIANS